MIKKNIAVISGGDSKEYAISIKSGHEVSQAIDPKKYNVYPIVIRGSDWYYKNKEKQKNQIDKNDFSLTLSGEKIAFDAVFVAIHGTPGEDGKLQGYFDLLKIPYTSCNHEVSALTFHKGFCNLIIRSLAVEGLQIADSILITNHDLIDLEYIIRKIGLPCFVKPVQSGSSVGVSKVKKKIDLPVAIESAFEICSEIMIERFIKGHELTCAVTIKNGKSIVFPIAEIISKKEFFDLEAKYNNALNQEIIPAPIQEALTKKIQSISETLFFKLRCKGVVRFDYIVNEHDEIFFLEANTVPGMTSESIVPKMVRAENINITDFYTMLIEDALQRKKKK
jgi:D-alanine-D-alanine ligase